MSASSSGISSATSSGEAPKLVTLPPQFKIVGIVLAVLSGVLIGSSFVFKKKGLLATQGDGKLGEGVGYLKSAMWWTGMVMMILGEILNFAAYSFVEAIVVTPLGALSVVICAILSHFFLKESLTVFGALGCALCIVGSVVIALNGPKEETIGQIREFEKLFIAPGFLAFGGVVIAACFVIIIFIAPKYGDKSMLWYISVCSLIGGLSVSCTTGLGAAIVTSIMGDNQFNYWFTYFLLGFVTVTLLTEIFYLNKALALFNTALVTPTYYVIFTSCTLITSIILYQGLKAPVVDIITLVMGFLTICLGITLLQMSKVDPTTLTKLDRRSTILLQAAQKPTELQEKSITGFEDPGMDSLRGGFGTIGSIIRARSMRKSMSGQSPNSPFRQRHPYATAGDDHPRVFDHLPGVQRHQLWDAPVRNLSSRTLEEGERISMHTQSGGLAAPSPGGRHRSIRFNDEDPKPSFDHHLTSSPPRELGPYDGLPTIQSGQSSLSKSTGAHGSHTRNESSVSNPFGDDVPSTARQADFGFRKPTFDSIASSTDSLNNSSNFVGSHRYPGGMSDSDKEESMGLVNKHGSPPNNGSGVRLVNRF